MSRRSSQLGSGESGPKTKESSRRMLKCSAFVAERVASGGASGQPRTQQVNCQIRGKLRMAPNR